MCVCVCVCVHVCVSVCWRVYVCVRVCARVCRNVRVCFRVRVSVGTTFSLYVSALFYTFLVHYSHAYDVSTGMSLKTPHGIVAGVASITCTDDADDSHVAMDLVSLRVRIVLQCVQVCVCAFVFVRVCACEYVCVCMRVIGRHVHRAGMC